ncbi:peroxiredoxin [Temperatibacter marinus]|uniref:Glutathione-dependent peroxiredoxin n=1 Tax=Temperatibacter marinus TaxID=1456591 RepID=A0AA52H909_9PROT|nr:peroxiredoxin [Temperatibacter marinus]WND02676.1 peroxiredoxin [Temperatibacter marinus]
MPIQAGDKMPEGVLVEMTGDGPAPHNTADLFAGKKVVFFAVPGAFTPTCSARHVPGYVEHAQALKDKGVDAVYCMSVNDAFVMGAWGKDQGSDEVVTMLADGNCDYTKSLDLVLDGSGFGMGQRSQRFALIVTDGVVEHACIEAPGDFKVSSAEHVVSLL